MKIALFTDGIHPFVVGGIQRHSFYLCKYLAKNGVLIDLYHCVENSELNIENLELFSDEEKENINSIVIDFPSHKRLPGHYVRESYEYSVFVYNEFLKRKDVDFVYSKNYTSWKFLEEKRAGVKLPPIGVKLHGYEAFQIHTSLRDYTYTFFHKPAIIFNTKYADIVFSYGGKITDLILENTGTTIDQVVEIPSGIDPDWILADSEINSNNENKLKLVFVGRFAKRKGIHIINKWIKKTKLDFQMTFVGPIPKEQRIIDPRIEYLGLIQETEELKKVLTKQDVLLCPSLAEGMPNVILEGMSCGCAILATDVGATSSMVNNDNGWLIKPNDYQDFEMNIESIFKTSDIDLTNKKLSSKEKVLRQFNWELISEQVIDTIQKFIIQK